MIFSYTCSILCQAFLTSVRHAAPLAVGVAGAGDAGAACAQLSRLCPSWCLASAVGDPSAVVGSAKDRVLNFVGGGSSPLHTAALAKGVAGSQGRALPREPASPPLRLAGRDATSFDTTGAPRLVGQRCNLTGSALFKGLMDAYRQTRAANRWQAAVRVASEQLADGADLVDVNLDSELLDSKWAMGKFLRLCATEPSVARAPVMISSASWPTIEEGLKNTPGKCVVNALSLVQGEQEFLRLAKAFCCRSSERSYFSGNSHEGLSSVSLEGLPRWNPLS